MCLMDLVSDMAAILNSLVSNSSYGMLMEQKQTNLPPEHEKYFDYTGS